MDHTVSMILERLNPQQIDAVTSHENLLVKACPGSGKTRVLTHKIAYNCLLYPQSLLRIIGITYTNRAADEIRDRLDVLGVDDSNVWIGTIHQFCLEFIIRPYAMYCEKTAKGFSIIDEYVQQKYIAELVKNANLELQSWQVNKINTDLDVDFHIAEKAHPQIVELYHQKLMAGKEIDFSLILTIASKIQRDFPRVSQLIGNTIRCIFVDEFQDTNELQYRIIGSIVSANTKIQAMFVGDVNQAIFDGLGGMAKTRTEIETLTSVQFEEKELNGCYRSTQRMIDYYRHYQVDACEIESLLDNRDVPGTIALNCTIQKDDVYIEIAKIISKHISLGTKPQDICVIAPQWFLLYPFSKKIKDLLPDIPFDAPDISPIKIDDMNVFYKMSKLVFTDSGKRLSVRKRIASEIIGILAWEYNVGFDADVDNYVILKNINEVSIASDDGLEYFKSVVEHLFEVHGITVAKYPQLYNAFSEFCQKVEYRITQHGLASDVESFRKVFKDRQGVGPTVAVIIPHLSRQPLSLQPAHGLAHRLELGGARRVDGPAKQVDGLVVEGLG